MGVTKPKNRAERRRVELTHRSVGKPSPASVPAAPYGGDWLDSRPTFSGRSLWFALGLIAINLLVYSPVWHHEFVNYDDPIYTSDPHVTAGLTWPGVVWAFTTGTAANWHPLTWLSYMLDVQIFGLNPGASHLVNVLFHIANTLLLFGLLHQMTGALGRSAFVAALFAVHPLHVESVAWVAERKDVLSTLFWLLTMWAYVAYVRRPGLRLYLLVCLFFALGLMSKPMLVTLPFVLLLLDFWPLGRVALPKAAASGSAPARNRSSQLGKLVWEKAPLFGLALASSIVTVVVQRRGGAVTAMGAFPLKYRLANAALSYAAYIGKMFWPARLAAFYPYPQPLPMWRAAASVLGLIAVSIVAIRASRKHGYLAVGWLWYLGTLVPVLGIVQAGTQGMADRYTYVPLIGLFIVLGWGISDLLEQWPLRKIALPAAAGLVIAACAVGARAQVGYWKNSETLWARALEVTTDNYIAQNNLGALLANEGRLAEAIPHYSEALRLQPEFAAAHNNLGYALAVRGRTDEAIRQFSEALRADPDYAEAHNNLGIALANQGKMSEAIDHFAAAVRIKPDFAEARKNLQTAQSIQR